MLSHEAPTVAAMMTCSTSMEMTLLGAQVIMEECMRQGNQLEFTLHFEACCDPAPTNPT